MICCLFYINFSVINYNKLKIYRYVFWVKKVVCKVVNIVFVFDVTSYREGYLFLLERFRIGFYFEFFCGYLVIGLLFYK